MIKFKKKKKLRRHRNIVKGGNFFTLTHSYYILIWLGIY